MKRTKKEGYRWNQVATFKIHIDQCSSAKMFRARSAKDKTEPNCLDSAEPVMLKLGTGKKYTITAFIRRHAEPEILDD